MNPRPIRTTLPLPDLPPVAPFPDHALPTVIREFMNDAAERISSPKDFIAVSAVTALSAVIGRKRTVRGKQEDDWTVVPNLWGMLIGPPSSMKSPSLRAALAPLDGLESLLADLHENALREHELELRLKKMQSAEQEKSVKLVLKSEGIDAARALLFDALLTEEPPRRPRLLVNDATVEKLQELLGDNPNGLLMVRDELGGLITKLEAEECAEQRAFLLLAHSGRAPFVIDRIGRGTIKLSAVCLSLLGGVQPSRISRLVKGAVSGLSDDGLLQRFQLAVWPDALPKWRWRDQKPCLEALHAYQKVFNSLHEIPGQDEPLPLTNEAYEQFKFWHIEMRAEVDGGDLAPALVAHLLKAPEAVLSLALIFQLCLNTQAAAVDEEAMRMAIEWAKYLRTHADRLYHSQSAPEVEAAKRLLRLKESMGMPFTARDVYRKNRQGLTREDVSGALSMLLDYGHLVETEIVTSGRPTRCYHWTY